MKKEMKIDDSNEQMLKRGWGLWFMPDGHMYVYYTPTHWRPVGAKAGK